MKNRKDTSINVRKRGSIAILITAAVLPLDSLPLPY